MKNCVQKKRKENTGESLPAGALYVGTRKETGGGGAISKGDDLKA